jgi:hypothetical protein
MMLEIKFAEWIAENHFSCCLLENGTYYWQSESKAMSHVSTDLLFDMFLDELSK